MANINNISSIDIDFWFMLIKIWMNKNTPQKSLKLKRQVTNVQYRKEKDTFNYFSMWNLSKNFPSDWIRA